MPLPQRLLLTALFIGTCTASLDRYPGSEEHQVRHISRHRPRRRSYYPAGWAGQQLSSEPYIWKPQVYQLTRPYFIPVFGAPGQIPIFYPPQPLLLNPGTPKENPMPVYKGPKYLPPSTDSTMTITDRFNGDDDDDDLPVWDSAVGQTLNSQTGATTPTRPPQTPDGPAFPPLVHDAAAQSSGTNHLTAVGAEKEGRPARPRPPAAQQPIRTTTTPAPPPRPSNCVWAIIACCSAESSTVPANCFEERGCSGPFWGPSPCDSEFAKQAVEAALKYYSKQAR